MTTPLDKTLKRGLMINEQTYVVAISPTGIKLTIKGRRNGVEWTWPALLNGTPSTGADHGSDEHSAG